MSVSRNSSSQDDSRPIPVRPSKRLRRWVKWLLIPLGSLAGLFLLVALGVWLVLTPARLTPMVNRWASNYLDADVRIDTVRLSLFQHFPYVSVQLKNGEIVSHAFRTLPDSLRVRIPASADTLLRFDDFALTFNVHALLASRVAIRRIELQRPRLQAYVAPGGKANWDIFPADTMALDRTAADTLGADTTTLPDLDLFVRRLKIGAGELVYKSCPDSLSARVDLERLALRGLRGHRYKIDLNAQTTVHQDTLRLCDTLPLLLQGGFVYDMRRPLTLGLDSLTVGVADLPATFTGEVSLTGDTLESRLHCRMNPWSLQSLLNLIPAQMMPRMHLFRTNLTADFNTTIRGTVHLPSGLLPVVSLDCRLDGGYLRYQGAKTSIDRLELDMSMYYHPRKPDSTGVELRHFRMEGSGVDVSASGSAWDLTGNTRIRTDMEGSIDLDKIGTLFPFPQGIQAHGRVGLNLDANVRKNQLNLRQIGQNRINARIDLDRFFLYLPQDTLWMAARGGQIHFGVNESRGMTDSVTIPAGEQVVYLDVRADSLNLHYKRQLEVATSGARLSMQNAASAFSGDTTVIHPFIGSAETRYLTVNGLDSTWIRTEEASTSFTIRPSAEDPAIPQLNLSVGALSLMMKSRVNFYGLNGTDVRLEATLSRMNRKGQQLRIQHFLDSLQTIYPDVPRDSLFARVRGNARRQLRLPEDDFASENLDLKVDNQIGALLRRWNARGSIYAINGYLATPYFPLPTVLRNVDIAYTTDGLDLNGTRIESGRSQMELTGKVSNLRQVLLGRGNLKVGMQMVSDTLDINELLLAANAGMSYAASDQAHKDSVLRAVDEQNLEQIYIDTAVLEQQSELLVIPSNLEVQLGLRVNHGQYADIVLNRVTGGLIVRDRCLQLNNLRAETDAGEMDLTALYATRSRQDITAGFDLEMHRMQVERLIHAVPSVDTLLPMLRSFEGVVDCQLAATVALDTAMNFILPTLQGVGRIHGDSLVLLDGETFSEIARMLRFKNRQRNLIDHISVEMIVRDNQIELFPFVLEMDRYQAAVSGIQGLDMSFDYHISVLRSPIPFRLGINITGTPDKFKWKLCRARYKNLNVPTYVELIDSTRLNLRKTLTEVFQRGVQAASLRRLQEASSLNAPREEYGDGESLTAADSILLRQSGVLPSDTLSVDTLSVDTAVVSSLTPTSDADLSADSSEPSPAERRAQRREQRREARQQRRADKAILSEQKP